jgi:hypothetical protein
MLVETDRLHAEPSRGGFRRFFQVLRPTVERPAAFQWSDVAAFGGAKNVGGVAAVASECPRDQGLVVANLVVADVIGALVAPGPLVG